MKESNNNNNNKKYRRGERERARVYKTNAYNVNTEKVSVYLAHTRTGKRATAASTTAAAVTNKKNTAWSQQQ